MVSLAFRKRPQGLLRPFEIREDTKFVPKLILRILLFMPSATIISPDEKTLIPFA